MKSIYSILLLLVIMSLYNCDKDKNDSDNDNALTQLEVIGTYAVTDTYVFTCPGGSQEFTKTYTYDIFVSNGSNLTTSLLAANVNESSDLFEGTITGNNFEISYSGCSFSGIRTNGTIEYSIGCLHSNISTYAADICDDGTFNPFPIIPQNLVSSTTTIVKQ